VWQAYQYHPGAAADQIPFPEALKEQGTARAEMLEELANLTIICWKNLEEINPPKKKSSKT